MSMSKADVKELMREVLKEKEERDLQNIPKESEVDHVLKCKDCYPKLIKKAKETMKHKCSNCGLPLHKDTIHYMSERCPLCGEDYNAENVEEIERE